MGSVREKVFPFTAIIGQEEMKRSLILNVINPKIGGVLIFGEKGTAKSTAVRALADLLPELEKVKGCRFNCDPYDEKDLCSECSEKLKKNGYLERETMKMKVVDLPVSATEDRVVGSLDIESAIKEGKKYFEHGILGDANRGILYVDEINLLDDHIVDLLLDSAAMGVNTVEREGISFSHPSNFILTGTMNPEEGDLRPQLLDRFGLSVDIKGLTNVEDRLNILKLREEFDRNPDDFLKGYEDRQRELSKKIVSARENLKNVKISDELMRKIVKIAIKLETDGHRGDLTLMRASLANAAFKGHKEVLPEDILETVKSVFLHRMASLLFENAKNINMDAIEEIIREE